MDKIEANDLLRYAIAFIRGLNVNAEYKSRLQHALHWKEELESYGFTWQSRILDYWIHRLQRGDFTPICAQIGDPIGMGEDSNNA